MFGSNRGMDLIDEISISVRKTKSTTVQHERVSIVNNILCISSVVNHVM